MRVLKPDPGGSQTSRPLPQLYDDVVTSIRDVADFSRSIRCDRLLPDRNDVQKKPLSMRPRRPAPATRRDAPLHHARSATKIPAIRYRFARETCEISAARIVCRTSCPSNSEYRSPLRPRIPITPRKRPADGFLHRQAVDPALVYVRVQTLILPPPRNAQPILPKFFSHICHRRNYTAQRPFHDDEFPAKT